MIKNYLTAVKQRQESSHGGTGAVDLYEIWGNSDFRSDVDFIDRVVVPPGSKIGFHQHGENQEMHIVLEGNELMNIENEEITVSKGDMILNPWVQDGAVRKLLIPQRFKKCSLNL